MAAEIVSQDAQALGGELVSRDFGYNDGWRTVRHVRLLADTTGDRRADVVAFGEGGVAVARAQADGRFGPSKEALGGKFGAAGFAGGWWVPRHLRLVTDASGDGRNDLVGFADDGMWVSSLTADGSFGWPRLVLRAFGWNYGWKLGSQARCVVKATVAGRKDVVAFGNDGVWRARGDGAGGYGIPQRVSSDFSYARGWRSERHPCFAADVTGDGRVDLVGFHDDGVFVANGKPDGTFSPAKVMTHGLARGWNTHRHIRLVADLSGDGRADLVGFGDDGVWVARSLPGGGFAAAERVSKEFGYNHGWRVDLHPRMVADLNGDGRLDLVGFGQDGVWVVRAKAGGGFVG